MLNRDALLHDIRSLMHGPLEGEPEALRERLERTLTDGYAHALALEGEGLQLEKELGDVARQLGDAHEVAPRRPPRARVEDGPGKRRVIDGRRGSNGVCAEPQETLDESRI